jgi:hypothetical protein
VKISQTTEAGGDRCRNLMFFSTPSLWPTWPYLPLVRRDRGRGQECGLLCDLMGLTGTTGYSSTVIACNLFLVPDRLDEFLALPKEVFDLPEEVYAAGWRID